MFNWFVDPNGVVWQKIDGVYVDPHYNPVDPGTTLSPLLTVPDGYIAITAGDATPYYPVSNAFMVNTQSYGWWRDPYGVLWQLNNGLWVDPHAQIGVPYVVITPTEPVVVPPLVWPVGYIPSYWDDPVLWTPVYNSINRWFDPEGNMWNKNNNPYIPPTVNYADM
jgi:hypothetical protein